jgi:RimJ/RimL family protein N-acetyltransferase
MNTYQSRDGRLFLIRQPVESDAENIINYSKFLFASSDQLLTTPGEYNMTIEKEKQWITSANQDQNTLVLVAEANGQIIGLLFFFPQTKIKIAHTGEFGVSVHPDFQGIGIGRKLVEVLLKWALENTRIEKVFLSVFATNHKAIKLYQDLGFREEGRHVKAVKQLNGEYVDVVQMYVETM